MCYNGQAETVGGAAVRRVLRKGGTLMMTFTYFEFFCLILTAAAVYYARKATKCKKCKKKNKPPTDM
jgi:hypothetical protein